MIFLVLHHDSALELLWGGESQLPQTAAAFNTPFFFTNHYQKVNSNPDNNKPVYCFVKNTRQKKDCLIKC